VTVERFTMALPWVCRGGILTPNQKAVYINLLDRQGANNHAWPSHATIARETCMSRSSVKRAIKDLEAMKLVRIRGRLGDDGKRTSNSYEVAKYPPGSVRTTPQFSQSYKEDSVQEDSSLNSSSARSKRSWENVSDEHRPSDKQLDHLTELIVENEGVSEAEAKAWVATMGIETSRDAHEAIKDQWRLKWDFDGSIKS
jgi:GntR family transcriptional regulator